MVLRRKKQRAFETLRERETPKAQRWHVRCRRLHRSRNSIVVGDGSGDGGCGRIRRGTVGRGGCSCGLCGRCTTAHAATTTTTTTAGRRCASGASVVAHVGDGGVVGEGVESGGARLGTRALNGGLKRGEAGAAGLGVGALRRARRWELYGSARAWHGVELHRQQIDTEALHLEQRGRQIGVEDEELLTQRVDASAALGALQLLLPAKVRLPPRVQPEEWDLFELPICRALRLPFEHPRVLDVPAAAVASRPLVGGARHEARHTRLGERHVRARSVEVLAKRHHRELVGVGHRLLAESGPLPSDRRLLVLRLRLRRLLVALALGVLGALVTWLQVSERVPLQLLTQHTHHVGHVDRPVGGRRRRCGRISHRRRRPWLVHGQWVRVAGGNSRPAAGPARAARRSQSGAGASGPAASSARRRSERLRSRGGVAQRCGRGWCGAAQRASAARRGQPR